MAIIKNLTELIANLCDNQVVMDVGCVGNIEYNDVPFETHLKYTARAVKRVGIDINAEEIEKAKTNGIQSKLYVADITNIKDISRIVDIEGRFTAIICTEIIEHITNVDGMMKSLYYALEPHGKITITTPNCLCPKWFHRMVQEGQVKINKDHVAWYDAQTLTQLVERYNFQVLKTYYTGVITKKGLKMMGIDSAPAPWMHKRVVMTIGKKKI